MFKDSSIKFLVGKQSAGIVWQLISSMPSHADIHYFTEWISTKKPINSL